MATVDKEKLNTYLTGQLNPHFEVFSQNTISKLSEIVLETANNVEKQCEKENEANLKKKDIEIEKLKKDFQGVKEECDGLLKTTKVHESALRQKDEKIGEMQQKMEFSENTLETAKAFVNKLQMERKELNEKIIGYESDLRQRDTKISTLEQYSSQVQLAVEQFKKENERLKREYESKLQNNAVHFRQEQANYEQKIQRLEETIRLQETVAPKRSSGQATTKPSEPYQPQMFNNGVVDDFNRWASNPRASSLPPAFKYLAGDLKIRTHQDLQPTSEQTRWICNINDREKYLFPNPNFFDPMTDISTLYEMNSANLREKGNNRIRVLKACEMNDKGFINFSGKLELL